MKPRALVLAILVTLLLPLAAAGPADAGPRAAGLRAAFGGTLVVPPEWAGIWSWTDSTYDCNGVFESIDAGVDTLCAGQGYDVINDTPYPISCSGTATATVVDVHCTAVVEVVTDCVATFDLEFNGTRTGDTYFVTAKSQTEFAGTAPECSFFPDQCSRTNTRATRIAAAPVEYCQTPVAPTTWGRVKTQYR